MPSIQQYPILQTLHNPTIVSIQAGIQHVTRKKSKFLERASQVLVNNNRDFKILQDSGMKHHKLIPPGLDTKHISDEHPDSSDPFTLMMASAPWEKSQFASKGIDLLLEGMANNAELRLILLWRGLLVDDLMKRVDHWGVHERVEIINERIDINRILKSTHAVVLLANSSDLVKAFPHSLIEGLAAGKPLITTQAIPMSDYIRDSELGEVLDDFSSTSFLQSVERLRSNYDRRRAAVRSRGASDFDPNRMLDQMQQIYAEYGVSVKNDS